MKPLAVPMRSAVHTAVLVLEFGEIFGPVLFASDGAADKLHAVLRSTAQCAFGREQLLLVRIRRRHSSTRPTRQRKQTRVRIHRRKSILRRVTCVIVPVLSDRI